MFKEMIDMNTFKAIIGYYGADYVGKDLNYSVLNNMIEKHVNNKAHIFKLFGNKLKIEREIEVRLNDYQAMNIQAEFVDELKKKKKRILAASLIANLSAEEFASNIIKRNLNIFNVSITKGTKVSKALMRLILPEDKHIVSTMHSMANQKLFAKGKIVLSIDPCDYLTMSSNKSGWRSCHRLDGGEYRTGPLAYLNDSSTVICYVESSTPCKFHADGVEYSHTNKTWRQIALVSPEATFAFQERQYPNSNPSNQREVAKIFKELFEKANEKSYQLVEGVDCEVLKDLHGDYACDNDVYQSLYYNDTLNDMYGDGTVIIPADLSLGDIPKTFELPMKGETVYCLECGEELERSSSLYCDCCYDGDDDEW